MLVREVLESGEEVAHLDPWDPRLVTVAVMFLSMVSGFMQHTVYSILLHHHHHVLSPQQGMGL